MASAFATGVGPVIYVAPFLTTVQITSMIGAQLNIGDAQTLAEMLAEGASSLILENLTSSGLNSFRD